MPSKIYSRPRLSRSSFGSVPPGGGDCHLLALLAQIETAETVAVLADQVLHGGGVEHQSLARWADRIRVQPDRWAARGADHARRRLDMAVGVDQLRPVRPQHHPADAEVRRVGGVA